MAEPLSPFEFANVQSHYRDCIGNDLKARLIETAAVAIERVRVLEAARRDYKAALMRAEEQLRWRDPAKEPPKPGVPVIALVINEYGFTRRIRAQYAAARTLRLDPECEGGTYDEETDAYWCNEGWYETNEYEETHWKVSGRVHLWVPLPPLPPNLNANLAPEERDA